MPQIQRIPWTFLSNAADIELNSDDLVVDNRVIEHDKKGWEFKCTVRGRNLTVTRIDENRGWCDDLYFRLYDPSIEKVPTFDNKSYTYYGLKNEMAPVDVEEVIVDSSVKVVREYAFKDCRMKRCVMGDGVERIERHAFFNCKSIKKVQLSRTLRYIDTGAFMCCTSIDCLYIPPNVRGIQDQAFYSCTGMKILILPANININHIGNDIVNGCDVLCENVRYESGATMGSRSSKISLKRHYDHLPLFRLFADPYANSQLIQQFVRDHGTAAFHQIDDEHGFTPLHILTRYNGFASDDMVLACFGANPSAIFVPDKKGLTPLDNLWNEGRVDIMVHLMRDWLCVHQYVNHGVPGTMSNRKRKKYGGDANTVGPQQSIMRGIWDGGLARRSLVL